MVSYVLHSFGGNTPLSITVSLHVGSTTTLLDYTTAQHTLFDSNILNLSKKLVSSIFILYLLCLLKPPFLCNT